MPNQFQKQLNSLKQQQHLMVMLIFLLVIFLTWTLVSLISSQKKLTLDKKLQELAKPLTPAIDVSVIDRLEQKRAFSPEELSDFSIYKVLRDKDGRIVRLIDIDEDVTAEDPTTPQSAESVINSLLSGQLNDQAAESAEEFIEENSESNQETPQPAANEAPTTEAGSEGEPPAAESAEATTPPDQATQPEVAE